MSTLKQICEEIMFVPGMFNRVKYITDMFEDQSMFDLELPGVTYDYNGKLPARVHINQINTDSKMLMSGLLEVNDVSKMFEIAFDGVEIPSDLLGSDRIDQGRMVLLFNNCKLNFESFRSRNKYWLRIKHNCELDYPTLLDKNNRVRANPYISIEGGAVQYQMPPDTEIPLAVKLIHNLDLDLTGIKIKTKRELVLAVMHSKRLHEWFGNGANGVENACVASEPVLSFDYIWSNISWKFYQDVIKPDLIGAEHTIDQAMFVDDKPGCDCADYFCTKCVGDSISNVRMMDMGDRFMEVRANAHYVIMFA